MRRLEETGVKVPEELKQRIQALDDEVDGFSAEMAKKQLDLINEIKAKESEFNKERNAIMEELAKLLKIGPSEAEIAVIAVNKETGEVSIDTKATIKRAINEIFDRI